MKAYALIGYQSPRFTTSSLEARRELTALKATVAAELQKALTDANLSWSFVGPLLRIRGYGYFDIEIARSFMTPGGRLRWAVRTRHDCPKHRLIVVRLQLGRTCVQDFLLINTVPRVVRYFTLMDSAAASSGKICTCRQTSL